MAQVLVIEDDAHTRFGLEWALRLEGLEVATAADGAHALRYLKLGQLPRVILLDLMMPHMNGWSFRRAQRADAVLADIPVVLLTGGADPCAAARHLGASAWFRKPYDLVALIALLRSACYPDTLRPPGSTAPTR
jgi:CheY-like chemotaxis protein